MKYRPGIIFIGMETSGALRRRFQARGYETYSCDLLPCEDAGGDELVYSDEGIPLGRHIVGDVFEELEHLRANDLWPSLAIFHPDCTYLARSGAWALKDPPYHQQVAEGTLVGAARRQAQADALELVRRIFRLRIRRKVIENPKGSIGSTIRRASQIVQPWQFGDNAAKETCLWFIDEDGIELPDMVLPIHRIKRAAGRIVPHKRGAIERWGNQSDKGQNNLSERDDRWKDRARTFPGLADAMVDHWVGLPEKTTLFT